MTQKADLNGGPPLGEPTWKQRAVERSTRAMQLRAEQRVQRFLDSAQAIMADKGTTDFTVQEVVDRSRQSLRSFYQHFDGKHELLLALFEDALSRTAVQIRVAADEVDTPLARLEAAVRLLFDGSRPNPAMTHPLFTDFAPRLLLTHPEEVTVAHAPVLTALTELMTEVEADSGLRPGLKPRRAAAMVMQTAMFLAQSSGPRESPASHPLTSDEVWTFCSGGFARD
jgi:AcrR family transcriptional regulator